MNRRKEPVIMNAMAKDKLTPHVVCVTEDMELRTVAQLFEDEAITGAPVVDARGHVVGVISQSDLVAHDLTAPRGVPPEALPAATVKDVMTSLVVTVEEETPLYVIVGTTKKSRETRSCMSTPRPASRPADSSTASDGRVALFPIRRLKAPVLR
jgi:CBS domain-containing protein